MTREIPPIQREDCAKWPQVLARQSRRWDVCEPHWARRQAKTNARHGSASRSLKSISRALRTKSCKIWGDTGLSSSKMSARRMSPTSCDGRTEALHRMASRGVKRQCQASLAMVEHLQLKVVLWWQLKWQSLIHLLISTELTTLNPTIRFFKAWRSDPSKIGVLASLLVTCIEANLVQITNLERQTAMVHWRITETVSSGSVGKGVQKWSNILVGGGGNES